MTKTPSRWPFPRLRFRLRHGHWCPHDDWSDWLMINDGMEKMRHCQRCGHTVFTG